MKTFIIITMLMMMASVASAESWIDNDTVILGPDTWYNFGERYNITGQLLYINDNYFWINGSYIFNISSDTEKCNVTIITTNSSQVEWNLSCDAGVTSVYHQIGDFSKSQFLYIDTVYNTTVVPAGNYVTINYTNGFTDVLFVLNPDDVFPVLGNATSAPASTYTNWPVTMTVDVTDTSLNVSSVMVQILKPNGEYDNWSMSWSAGDTYSTVYTNTSLIGNYDIEYFWACDYAGNCESLATALTIAVSNATGSEVEPGDGGGILPEEPPLPEIIARMIGITPGDEEAWIFYPFNKRWDKMFEVEGNVTECSVDNPEFECFISEENVIVIYEIGDEPDIFKKEKTILVVENLAGNKTSSNITLNIVNLYAYYQIDLVSPLHILNQDYLFRLDDELDQEIEGVRYWWVVSMAGLIIIPIGYKKIKK